MKIFATTLIAFAMTAGTFAAPAFANSDDTKLDTLIVEINSSAGIVKLANGMTLDQSLESFSMPVGASVGDKVRLTFDDTNDLRRVTVLR